MTVTVAVVDDQPLIRTGLRAMLEHDGGIELVGEADDGEKAFALARRLRPAMILMDIRMPVLDGSRPRGASAAIPIWAPCG